MRQNATRSGKARSSDTSGSDTSSASRRRPASVMPYTFLPRAPRAPAATARRWAPNAANSPASEPDMGLRGAAATGRAATTSTRPWRSRRDSAG